MFRAHPATHTLLRGSFHMNQKWEFGLFIIIWTFQSEDIASLNVIIGLKTKTTAVIEKRRPLSPVICFDGIPVIYTRCNFPIGEGQASQRKRPFSSISSWISLLMESKMAQDLSQYLHSEYGKAFTRPGKLSECKTAFNCVSTRRWNIVHTTQSLSTLSSTKKRNGHHRIRPAYDIVRNMWLSRMGDWSSRKKNWGEMRTNLKRPPTLLFSNSDLWMDATKTFQCIASDVFWGERMLWDVFHLMDGSVLFTKTSLCCRLTKSSSTESVSAVRKYGGTC